MAPAGDFVVFGAEVQKMKKNNIRTSKETAKKAGSLLQNSSSAKVKSVAGSALNNRKAKTKG